jgi:hypothetical protein
VYPLLGRLIPSSEFSLHCGPTLFFNFWVQVRSHSQLYLRDRRYIAMSIGQKGIPIPHATANLFVGNFKSFLVSSFLRGLCRCNTEYMGNTFVSAFPETLSIKLNRGRKRCSCASMRGRGGNLFIRRAPIQGSVT